MSEPPNPEVAVFAAALELPGDQRSAYLDQACAGNPDLRRQVEALLRVHDDAGNFFDKLAQSTAAESAIPAEKAGDRIGRYKLLQQIGEGGCGVVYMAEQEEPVRRKVALKVIKLGMDTKSVIARFEAERQALALMDHPNIARVLDAGATDTGRPYFVMELVRGVKITDYCDKNNLSTATRLDLFVQVCQAIQHAHQKGIIHRDIKPSNIMVTVNDGVAVPKMIDFGIAKATQGRLTDHTLFTAFEQFLGTPAYMSPEQAEMTSLDIDTRSDIYSLGVLLYELLTGQTPFDTQELLQVGLDEIRRTIREQEPASPSTRLSTMLGADLTAIAKRRSVEPPRLLHLLRGDLDWIVMKALEKDRARRYETANGLAADIQRHLSDEPVVARPPDNFYRFQKMVRRNKLVVAASTAVVGSLILGLGASTWFLLRERQALREAAAAHASEAILREKLRESVRQFAEVQATVREQQPAEDAAALQRRTYDELARELGVDSKALQEKLPLFARELKYAPDAAPLDRANAAYVANDYAEAIKSYREAAEAGDSQAQYRLGCMYEYGQGVQLDYAEAVKWYRKSAEAGNSSGQEALAYQYAHGRGIKEDPAEAFRWYRKSAEAGNSKGQDGLAYQYETGRGVQQDSVAAFKWYRKSAEAGNSRGQNGLAYHYESGHGVQQDYAQAVRWYRKSAEAGDNDGRLNLARMDEKGLGVQTNYAEAAKWYRIAADSGDNDARNKLGWMYENGLGLEEDINAADLWYRKAAETGDAAGQRNLGRIEKEIREAGIAYHKAAVTGDAKGQTNLARILADNFRDHAGGNEVCEVVKLDDVPLTDAISSLSFQAGLNIQFDPRLANTDDVKVTATWTNVTARQALQALLDGHGLKVIQIPGNPILRFVAKNLATPPVKPR